MSRPLRIASWPGPGFRDNEVIRLFCQGLSAAGGEVVGVDDPETMRTDGVDVLQVHWPEALFWQDLDRWPTVRKARAILGALDRVKRQGGRVVWMVHNLAPHDMDRWRRLVWFFYQRGLSRRVDGFLTLSPSTLHRVRRATPGLAAKPAAYVWHPAYPGAAKPDRLAARVRKELGFGPGTRVFGYFGLIRPYKDIDQLVQAFRERPDEDAGLIIAGAPQDGVTAAELSVLARSDPRIRLIFRQLERAEFDGLLAAADEVVAPLRRYLHSGSIVHALSAGRPVLTPQTPFAADLQEALGETWMRLYAGPLVGDILFAGKTAPPGTACPIHHEMSFEQAGQRMMAFYRTLGAPE